MPVNTHTLFTDSWWGSIRYDRPRITGLNPQRRNQALGSWNPVGIWDHDMPEQEVKMIKPAVTNVTQALGKLGGLDDAAYFNEADPNDSQRKNAFFGVHYDRLLKIKREVDPEGVLACNRCVGYDGLSED
ncbi:FAD-binding domain protein [Ceratobasidium sp. AG-Ba]|nr:FAD-binding domain protein [Ceratobasidium sp. AG-Ba]